MKHLSKLFGNPLFIVPALLGGILIFISSCHNHAHFTMEKDANGYVYRWCKKNPDICTHRGNGY